MKIKRFDKKLTLNKETIADLSNDQMEAVKGGKVTLYTPSGCPTPCDWSCIMC
jgi:natural product precursor